MADGIFDFLARDENRMALGLLAQGGDFGRALAGAVQYADQGKANKRKQAHEDLQNQLLQTQMANYQSEIRNRDLAAVRDARRQSWLTGDDEPGGAPGAAAGAGQGMPAPGGMGGGGGGASASTQAPRRGGLLGYGQELGLDPRLLRADMALTDGKNITDLLSKRALPKWENINGNLVNTNAPGFQGGIQDQVQMGPDGRATILRGNGNNPIMGAVPGSFDTYAAYKDIDNRGAVAVEQAKSNIAAENDLVEITLPGGQTVKLPRAQALTAARGQGQPQGGGLPGVGGGQQLSPALRDMIARDAAANGIDNPTTRFTGAQRGQAYGLANAAPAGAPTGPQGAQGLPGLQVQSAAGAAFQGATAKADADQLNAWRDAATAANSSLETASKLRAAVERGTYAGGGAQAKTSVASLLSGLTGVTPKGLPGSEQFNAAASALVLDRIKTLGANPSNADRDFIERTVPNLSQGKETQKALIDFIEQKSRSAIALHRRADTFARQNNGLGGFDQFAQPEQPPGADSKGGKVVNFMDLK